MVSALDRFAYQIVTPGSAGMAKTGASTPVNTAHGVRFASAKHVTHGKNNTGATPVQINKVDKATGRTVQSTKGVAVASKDRDLSIIKPAQGLGIKGLNIAANNDTVAGTSINNRGTGFGGGQLNDSAKGGKVVASGANTFSISSPGGNKFIPGDSGSGAITGKGEIAGVVSTGEVNPAGSKQQVNFAKITQTEADTLAELSEGLTPTMGNKRMSSVMLQEAGLKPKASNDDNYALAA